MSGFSFRGVHSSKFGIYTQDTSRIILPPRREGKVVISCLILSFQIMVCSAPDQHLSLRHSLLSPRCFARRETCCFSQLLDDF